MHAAKEYSQEWRSYSQQQRDSNERQQVQVHDESSNQRVQARNPIMQSPPNQQQVGCQQHISQPVPITIWPASVNGTFQDQPRYLSAHPTQRIWPNYASKASAALGAVVILVAVLSIIFNAIAIAEQVNRMEIEKNSAFFSGPAFWATIFLFLAGGFAIGAAKQKTTCIIVANMVLSIIASLFCLVLLGGAAAAVALESSDNNFFIQSQHKVSLALGIMMIIMALIGFICVLISSGLSCAAVCCGKSSQTDHAAQVIYMYPMSQPVPGLFPLTVPQNSEQNTHLNPMQNNQEGQLPPYEGQGASAPFDPPPYNETIQGTLKKKSYVNTA